MRDRRVRTVPRLSLLLASALLLCAATTTGCDSGKPRATNSDNSSGGNQATATPGNRNGADANGGSAAGQVERVDISAQLLAVARAWTTVRDAQHSVYLRYAWAGGAPRSEDGDADDVDGAYAHACELAPELDAAIAALVTAIGRTRLHALEAGDPIGQLARDAEADDTSGLTTHAMRERAAIDSLLAVATPIIAHGRAQLSRDGALTDRLGEIDAYTAALTATTRLLMAIGAHSLPARATAREALLLALAQARALLKQRPPLPAAQTTLRATLTDIALAWPGELAIALRAQHASDAGAFDDAIAAGAAMTDEVRRYYLIVDALHVREVLPAGNDLDVWISGERAQVDAMYDALVALAGPLAPLARASVIDAPREPMHALRDRAIAIDAQFAAPDAPGAIAGRLAARALIAIEADLQLIAACGATDVAAALERVRAEESLYPVQLTLMTPKYLPRAPVDPATGLAWRYRRRAGEPYRLASVGLDDEDNGGTAPDDWPFEPE